MPSKFKFSAKILAIFLIIASALFLLVGYVYGKFGIMRNPTLPLFFIILSGLFLKYRHKYSFDVKFSFPKKFSFKTKILNEIAFLILLIFLLLELFVYEIGHLLLFPLFVFAITSIASSIFLYPKKLHLLIILKLTTIISILNYNIFNKYHFPYGIDNIVHKRITENIMVTGEISGVVLFEETKYTDYYPGFHTFFAQLNIILSTDYMIGFYLFILLFFFTIFLFVYLIGKRFFSEKLALMACIFFSINGYIILLGTSLIPNFFSIIIFLPALFLLISHKPKSKIFLLYSIFVLCLNFIHPYPILLLIVSLLTFVLYRYFSGLKISNTKIRICMLLIPLLLFTYSLIREGDLVLSLLTYNTMGTNLEEATSLLPQNFSWMSVHNSLNQTLYEGFFSFSILIYLYSVKDKIRKEDFLIILAGVIIFIRYTNMFIPIMVTYRTLSFAIIGVSILFVVAISNLIGTEHNVKKTFYLMFVIGVISLLVVSSTSVNPDGYEFNDELSYRKSLTESEFKSYEFVKNNNITKVSTDDYFYLYFRYNGDGNLYHNSSSNILQQNSSYILLRDYIIKEPALLLRSGLKNRTEVEVFEGRIGETKISNNKIYSNGNTHIIKNKH